MGIEEHVAIILDALQDYRRWFDMGEGLDSLNESDKEMVERINNAIEYLEQA